MMNNIQFFFTEHDILEIRMKNRSNLFDLGQLYYINNLTKDEHFIAESALIEFVNTFQSLFHESVEEERSLLPALFEKGIGYYYLLDCFLIYKEIKLPCSWTDYLQSMNISTHHNFLWLYKLEGRFYLELSRGITFFINKNNEIEERENLFETALLLRSEVLPDTLIKISMQSEAIKNEFGAQ